VLADPLDEARHLAALKVALRAHQEVRLHRLHLQAPPLVEDLARSPVAAVRRDIDGFLFYRAC
jgi:hypothetical protein